MPKTLAPVPSGVAFVDPKDGTLTDFGRLRWEDLRNGFLYTPTVANDAKLNQTAALVATAVFTTKTDGQYRLSSYLRKTVADGVGSSLIVTWGWTDRDGTALTAPDAALLTDTTSANQSGSKLVWAKANTDITYAIAYVSTGTPNKMKYNADVCIEQMAIG